MEATGDLEIRYSGTLYFTRKELACPRTGLARLAIGFATDLLYLRIAYDTKMPISCCRSFAHNKAIGGHKKSLHVYDHPYIPTTLEMRDGRNQAAGAAAFDMAKPADPLDGVRLVKIAIEKGWSVGVASWGFHMDRRNFAIGLPSRIFGYGP